MAYFFGDDNAFHFRTSVWERLNRVLPHGPNEIAGVGGTPDNCAAALRTARQTQAAVQRANSSWAVLDRVASANNIDPALLGAIGIRESGFLNVNQRNGNGVGVFQIDLGQHPEVTAQQAGNFPWAANWAAHILDSNSDYLSAKFPNFTASQLLQATAASYNIGRRGISGNPSAIDKGTAGGNYGSNVVQLMDCF